MTWPEFTFPPLNLINFIRTSEMREIWFNEELVEMYYE